MSGYIGKNELATQVIIYNMCFLCFSLAYGISLAASSLIGNSLGALNPDEAKKYALLILFAALVVNFSTALAVYLFRWQISAAYIARVDFDSEQVFLLTGETLPFLALHLIFDMTQGVTGGIIRGLGL